MIPLCTPSLSGNEWKYIKECLDTNWVSSVGSYVDLFEENITQYCGSKFAVSVVNGTSALHLSLQLAGVEKDDYVIVPNITFIASANSIKYLSAHPIFVDVDPHTWQFDLNLIEEFLSTETEFRGEDLYHLNSNRRIKAIMPVHVLGNMAQMDKLVELANRYKLTIIEDATEALGSKFNGKHASTFGEIGCLSFNGNKIITTGGGGMIVTDNPSIAKQAKHLSTQAKSDSFEYVHDNIGYNYRMVNVLAALGVAQLEKLPEILNRKKEINDRYRSELVDLNGLEFQKVEEEVTPNNWLFTILTDKQEELIKSLLENDIQVRKLWIPMNRLQMFEQDRYLTKYNHSESVYNRSISLPCSANISDKELELVIKHIKRMY